MAAELAVTAHTNILSSHHHSQKHQLEAKVKLLESIVEMREKVETESQIKCLCSKDKV